MSENQYWVGWAAGSWGVSWGYDSGGEPIEVYDPTKLVPAGHWKNLFKPVRDVSLELGNLRGKASVKFVKPSTTDGRVNAEIYIRGVRTKGSLNKVELRGYAAVQLAGVRSKSSASRVKLRGNATVSPLSVRSSAKIGRVAVSASSVVKLATCRGTGLADQFWIETTHNPTEEELVTLLW